MAPPSTAREMTKEPTNKPLKAALIFGIVAATIELAVILWVAYC